MNTQQQNNAILWARAIMSHPNVLVCDTETTGKDPKESEMLSVAVYRWDQGNRREKLYHELIRPVVKQIPDGATAVHGIAWDHVANKPNYKLRYENTFKSLFAGKIIVAYNADYDRQIFETTSKRNGVPIPEWLRWSCAMKAYADFRQLPNQHGYKGFAWIKLEKAYEHEVGKAAEDAHDAGYDVLMTMSVIEVMAKKELVPEGQRELF